MRQRLRPLTAALVGCLAVTALGTRTARAARTLLADEAPPGTRIKLSDGQLFIPEGFKPDPAGLDLTLHLHGAYAASEANLVRAKQPGVLVTVILPGLSAVYSQRFNDPEAFQRILRETAEQLKDRFDGKPPTFRSVTVTSFSAGFGGVREMLKDAAAYARIDRMVLADTVYAGYVGDPALKQVDPANMAGFLRFARDAAEGKKRLVLSYSQLQPEGYASTGETARYLVAGVGGVAAREEPAGEDWPGGMRLLTRFKRGEFEVLGFDGADGAAHMKHLHNLSSFLVRIQ